MENLSLQNQCSKHDRGFTIVELLIAITLVGVIMTLVFSSIWTARRSWESVVEKIDASESMRLSQGFLRRNISQARTVFVPQEDGEKVLFHGDATSLQFVAPAPMHQQLQASLYVYTIYFVAGGAGEGEMQVAYMNYLPGRASFNVDEFEETFVLAGEVTEVEIDYFGQKKADSKAGWLSEWEREDSLPELVRLKITVADGDEAWPELVIPIRGLAG